MGFGAFYNQGPLPMIGPGAQLAKAAQDYPAQEQAAKDAQFQQQERKAALKQQDAQAEQQTQAQSLAKMGLYYKMIQNDPSGVRTKDPAFIKAVNDAAKDAGLPPMSHMDPATGMEVLDPNALRNLVGGGKTYDQLDSAQQTAIGNALPGQQRDSLFQLYGVDKASVPDDVRTMQPLSTFKGREDVIKDFTNQVANIPKGTGTVEGLQTIFSTMKNELAESGVSVSDLQDIIKSPAFAQQVLAPQAAAKAQQLRAMGVKDDAITDWYNKRTELAPQELAAKVKFENGRLTIDQERLDYTKDIGYKKLAATAAKMSNDSRLIDARVKEVNALTAKATQGQELPRAKLVADLADKQLKPLEDQRKSLIAQENAWITAHGSDDTPFPPELVQRITDLNGQIDGARQSITDLQTAIESGKSSALSNLSGKNARVLPKAGYLDMTTIPDNYERNSKTGQIRDPATGKVWNADGSPSQ